MLANEGDIMAYGGWEDQNLLFYYERADIPKRVKETERLISEDSELFKTFVMYVKQEHDKYKSLDETPDELLQINTDNFLEEGVIEYLNYDLDTFNGNKEVKKLKSKNYSSLSAKSSK